MRGDRNPTRRNRNIGTAASGHGDDNRLVIPSRWNGPTSYWRDLGEYRSVKRVVSGRELTFIVEKTNRGCVHACTVEDIVCLLGDIPPEDWEGLSCFVLRQPKRKEAILNGVWGRLAYGGVIGRPQDGMLDGPAVFLEATTPISEFSLGASMWPDAQAEFERLRRDGHSITRSGRRFTIQCSIDTVRSTQLYRTIPHEIGHWLDWLEKVQRPVAPKGIGVDEYDWRESLKEQYNRRPAREREVFAHRYADRFWTRLSTSGVIPFEKRLDFDGLDPADFGLVVSAAELTPAAEIGSASDIKSP